MAEPRGKSMEGQVVGDYLIGGPLGEGNFAKVFLGIHQQTRKKVALKFIEYAQASEKEKLKIQREVKLMEHLKHPNIVKMDGVIKTEQHTVLILEYVNGGELFEYIVGKDKLDEDEARTFLRQIISALDYCHYHKVVHRDLKPENLLLDYKNQIKITDFGLGNFTEPGIFLESNCGSPLYAAPEILMQCKYLGPQVDIWALGVVLYAMVTGYLPWEGKSLPDQLRNAAKANFSYPPDISQDCKNLISRMLTVDTQRRATVEEIRHHPWANKGHYAPPPSCTPPRHPLTRDEVDEEIVDQLVGLGYNREECYSDLQAGKTTQAFVLYYLIAEEKRPPEGKPRSMTVGSLPANFDRMMINPPAAAPQAQPQSPQIEALGLDASPNSTKKKSKNGILNIFTRKKGEKGEKQ
eukprot:TRINITY_DN19961_c0_g1_i1.p1 TRINITY_DN19961_c0_g1~~TRINITY_DN19961_c0_g1_i1.p1  ORF type:complete len:408 (+),score=112.46 TRINITY_DN19961_c0_g1_i1:89-1312(+)